MWLISFTPIWSDLTIIIYQDAFEKHCVYDLKNLKSCQYLKVCFRKFTGSGLVICHKRYHERYSFGKKKKTKVIFQNKFGYFFLFNHINIFNHINHIFLFNQYLITYEQQLDSSQRRNYNPVRYLPLTIFVESSVTDVWRVSKYVFVRFSFPNLSIFPDYINTCIYIYIYIYIHTYI